MPVSHQKWLLSALGAVIVASVTAHMMWRCMRAGSPQPTEEDDVPAALQAAFDEATRKFRSQDHEVLLRAYGLFKRATVGVQVPSASLLDLRMQTKYKAWRAACELSKEEAMHKYIELAREHNKESVATLPKHQTNAHRQSDGFVVQSRPVLEEETAESNAPALIQELQHEKNHAIEMLKSNSSLLFERDDSDMTALHWAADRNAVEFLKVALAIDEVDIDVSNANGETPLYMAAFCGHAESVQLLVDAGADPHKKNNDDESPVDVGNRKCRSLMLSLDEMTSEYAIADSGSHTSLSDESDLGLSSDDELLVNSIGR